jgi:hypothetical protein
MPANNARYHAASEVLQSMQVVRGNGTRWLAMALLSGVGLVSEYGRVALRYRVRDGNGTSRLKTTASLLHVRSPEGT